MYARNREKIANELGNKAAQRKNKLAGLAPEADKLQSIAEICPLRELSLLKAEVEDCNPTRRIRIIISLKTH